LWKYLGIKSAHSNPPRSLNLALLSYAIKLLSILLQFNINESTEDQKMTMSKPKESTAKQENVTLGGAKSKQSANDWKVKTQSKCDSNTKNDENKNKSNPWGPMFKDREHFNQMHHF